MKILLGSMLCTVTLTYKTDLLEVVQVTYGLAIVKVEALGKSGFNAKWLTKCCF